MRLPPIYPLVALLAACAPAGGPPPAASADLAPSAGADLASTTGADLAPGPGADLAGGWVDDDFSDAATLSRWQDLLPANHDSLAISGGKLRTTPTVRLRNHWFGDEQGVFLYQLVSGDFVVEVDVTAARRGDAGAAPRGEYSAGGLLLRDPKSRSPGQQRWVMYNLGYQPGGLAREVKDTRDSVSVLTLISSGGQRSGRLRVCRLGRSIRFFHRMPGAAEWSEESPNGSALRFDRPDLPERLQVGLMAGHWEAPLELAAEFESVRLLPATDAASCVR